MGKSFEIRPVSPKEIVRKILLRDKHEAFRDALKVVVGHGGDWMAAVIAGLTSVIFDDPDRDRYEYDFFDPQIGYAEGSREEVTTFFDELERSLGAKQVEGGEWSKNSGSREPEAKEFRVIVFETKIPGLLIHHVEYRYPSKPEWGVCLQRVINRVSPTKKGD